MKMSHLDIKCDQPNTKPVVNGQGVGSLVAQIQKHISVIPLPKVIDFVAIWIYLVLFSVFNYIYWRPHMN